MGVAGGGVTVQPRRREIRQSSGAITGGPFDAEMPLLGIDPLDIFPMCKMTHVHVCINKSLGGLPWWHSD